MAKYLKIPSLSGNDLYIYDTRYQFNSADYTTLLELDPVTNTNSVIMNGIDTNMFYKDINFSMSICSVGIKVRFSEESFNKEFGLFGYGTQDDYLNHRSWGLIIKKDNNDNIKKFHLVLSNETLTLELPFNEAKFNNLEYNKDDWYSIVLVQSLTTAKLYINGIFKDLIDLPIVPRRTTPIGKFYIGSIGELNSWDKFIGSIKEVGLWRREIDLFDIEDLNSHTDIGQHPNITPKSKKIKISGGKIYFDGLIHDVPEKSLYIKGVGEESIYLVISSSIVTADDDPVLNDTAIEYYNFGKPGADRLRYVYDILINPTQEDLKDKTSLLLLKYIDGNLVINNLKQDTPNQNNSNPDIIDNNITQDKALQLLYDKLAEVIYDIHGNFIVSGLAPSISIEKDNILIRLSTGSYYLNGKKYKLVNNIVKSVTKTNSTGNVFNENIMAKNVPVALNRQPVANIESIVGQVKKTKTLIKGTQDGRDILDRNVRRIIDVYDANGVHYTIGDSETDTSKSCWLDGNYINWSLNGPEPISQVGVTPGQAYTVEYVRDSALIPDLDYKLIKGNKYIPSEDFRLSGFDIPISLQFKPTHILSIKSGGVSLNPSIYELNENNELIFPFDKKPDTLNAGDTLTIEYAYNNVENMVPKHHIVFFFTSGLIPDSYGQINYKYLLSDIYTLIINNDNVIEVLKGLPGINDTYQKANIPDNCIPIADVMINAYDIKQSAINYYNYHRMLMSEIRSLVKRIADVEEKVILMELEKNAEKKSQDPSLLKGIFVDAMDSFTKSNYLDKDYNALINIYDKRLTSGIDLSESFTLEPTNKTSLHIYDQKVTFKDFKTESLNYQNHYNNTINLNNLGNSRVYPSLYISNEYLLDSDYDNKINNYIVNNILSVKSSILPNNPEVDIYQNNASGNYGNSYSNMSITNMRILMDNYKKMLSDLNMVLPDTKKRKFIIEGGNFSPIESDLTLKFGEIDNYNDFKVINNILEDNGLYYVEDGGIKYYLSKNYTDFTWVKDGNKIKCNKAGEFVILVTSPDNSVSNTHNITIKRNNGDEITYKANFNGLINSLVDVIVDGKRTNTTYFSNDKYSISNIPGLVQSFTLDKNKTINSLDLYFTEFDKNYKIIVDIVELSDNNIIQKVLSRNELVADDANSIVNNKLNIKLKNPLTLLGSKKYGISISSLSLTTKLQSYKMGLPSLDDNISHVVSNNLFNTLGTKPTNMVLNLIESEMLRFNFNAIDVSDSNKDPDNFYYYEVIFDKVVSPKEFSKFILLSEACNRDVLNTKVEYQYTVNDTNWFMVRPYSLIDIGEKVNGVKVKVLLKTKDKNITPQTFQNIKIIIPRYIENSSYISRYFNVDDTFDNYVAKIYYNVSTSPNSTIKAQVAFNSKALFRDAVFKKSKELYVIGTTTHKEEHWEFPFRLTNPEIIAHEVTAPGTGKFRADSMVLYRVAVLDKKTNQVISMTPDNVADQYSTYKVIVPSDRDMSSIIIKVFLDPEMYGFRLYRSIDGSPMTQVYDSTVIGGLSNNVLTTDNTITLTDASLFPNSGTIRIDNEFMKYTNKSGNVLTGIFGKRGLYDTPVQEHQAVVSGEPNKVYLFDYAGYHNNIYDGQKPPFLTYHNVTLNDRQEKYRWFLVDIEDNNEKFSPTANIFNDAWKTINETTVIPKNVGIRLNIKNELDTKSETMTVHNLICNVEYVK